MLLRTALTRDARLSRALWRGGCRCLEITRAAEQLAFRLPTQSHNETWPAVIVWAAIADNLASAARGQSSRASRDSCGLREESLRSLTEFWNEGDGIAGLQVELDRNNLHFGRRDAIAEVLHHVVSGQ